MITRAHWCVLLECQSQGCQAVWARCPLPMKRMSKRKQCLQRMKCTAVKPPYGWVKSKAECNSISDAASQCTGGVPQQSANLIKERAHTPCTKGTQCLLLTSAAMPNWPTAVFALFSYRLNKWVDNNCKKARLFGNKCPISQEKRWRFA